MKGVFSWMSETERCCQLCAMLTDVMRLLASERRTSCSTLVGASTHRRFSNAGWIKRLEGRRHLWPYV